MINEFKEEFKKIKSFKEIGDLTIFSFEMGLWFRLDYSEWFDGVFDRYMKSNHAEYYSSNRSDVLEIENSKKELFDLVRNKYIEINRDKYKNKEPLGEGDILYLEPNDQLMYRTICWYLNNNKMSDFEKKITFRNKYLLEVKIIENKKRGKLYETMFNSPRK